MSKTRLALELLYQVLARMRRVPENVWPARLLDSGYAFAFSKLETALRSML